MGYTHYYKNKPAFTEAQWEQLKAEARKLFKTCGVPLANPGGKRGTKPHINDDYISFNGVEDNSYESAYVKKYASDFEFCKTARKPYDKVVVEFYKLIRKIAPQTSLSSDGGNSVFAEKSVPSGNKIVVNGKYTFYSGGYAVFVGDTVTLPSAYKPGDTWEGVVTALKSDYCGDIKTILGVTPLKVPTKPIVVKPTPTPVKQSVKQGKFSELEKVILKDDIYRLLIRGYDIDSDTAKLISNQVTGIVAKFHE